MFEFIKKLFKKKKKIEPPEERAIIKMSEIAKENGIYDDENKIIELTRNGNVDIIKYSEADVEALREMGIPVEEEVYTDEFDWIEGGEGGGVETRK